MRVLKSLWSRLTTPLAPNEDEARQEHMTRVILATMGAFLFVLAPIVLAGWLAGALPLDMLTAVLFVGACCGAGLWLAQRGRWRWSRYIAPAVTLGIAMIDTYTYGLWITNMMEYLVVILLTVLLLNPRAQWAALLICLGASLSLDRIYMRRQGLVMNVVDLAYWLTSIGAFFTLITLLLRFFTAQFRHALDQSRVYAAELARQVAEQVRAQNALRQERDLSHALADAAAAVSRTLDPDEILDRLLEQVSRVIPNDAASVMLIDRENRARMARWRGDARSEAEISASTVHLLDTVPDLRQRVEAGEPVVIPDTWTYPGWEGAPGQSWLRSYAGAPVRVRGAVTGLLNVYSATPGFLSPSHAHTLSTFADHAAIALQNAQLYQGRVRAERLLSTLNRAALSIARATTTGEILSAAAGELRSLGLVCTVFMLDDSQDRLYPIYLGHHSPRAGAVETPAGLAQPRFTLPLRAIQTEWQTLLDQQAILIEDTGPDIQALMPGAPDGPAGGTGNLSGRCVCIVATLLVQEEVIGLLWVDGEDLTRGDMPGITALAHQIAAAWHKAGLMQSLQDSLEELKRTQAQLIQAQKMEAVGRLAGGVAHDFNNHLTAIRGYAEMVLLELDPQDPRRQDIHEIQRAADRSADLTRQLLAFSRKQIIQPRVLDLNDVIQNMRRMLERLIGEDITLHTAPAPQLGRVMADPGQIEQVVMNLAVNARDAIDEKAGAQGERFVARLAIETANVELDEAYAGQRMQVESGPYVMLSVSDNGIGMDQETMSHLFEPFFTTKEQGRGTGLGLATVYGIVKQNNGYVFPYSEPGVGTTFKVYLPRVDAAVELAPGGTQAAAGGGSETILLVEDEGAVRGLARRILEGQGYRVLEAASADDALRVWEGYTEPIHLILTDVVVPGLLSSKELVDRILQARPEIRVIYMSGYTDDVIAHRGVLDPSIQFVQKPFTPGVLALRVRRALGERDPGTGRSQE